MGITGCKRSREEEQDVPMGLEVVWDPRPKPTIEDSILFLWTMECELAGEREKYAGFISIMREVKNGKRQNLTSLVEDIKTLLAGHPSLIRGFNRFLPWDYIRSHGPAGAEGSGTL